MEKKHKRVGKLLKMKQEEGLIVFYREDLGDIGHTDFRQDLWDELVTVKWYLNYAAYSLNVKTYIYTGSGKLIYKDLHQVVIKIWYGLEKIKEAYANDYIVEHHDNNEFNCRIRNLSFAKNSLNLTKAHSYDKTKKILKDDACIDFCKDFNTGLYQINMAFSDLFLINVDGQVRILDRLHLIYEDNFRLVYTDANRLVDELLENKSIDFRLLSPKRYYYEEATFVVIDSQESMSGLVNINGNYHFVPPLNEPQCIRIDSIEPLEHLYNDEQQ